MEMKIAVFGMVYGFRMASCYDELVNENTFDVIFRFMNSLCPIIQTFPLISKSHSNESIELTSDCGVARTT